MCEVNHVLISKKENLKLMKNVLIKNRKYTLSNISWYAASLSDIMYYFFKRIISKKMEETYILNVITLNKDFIV
jgi:hypothetical protein